MSFKTKCSCVIKRYSYITCNVIKCNEELHLSGERTKGSLNRLAIASGWVINYAIKQGVRVAKHYCPVCAEKKGLV